MDKATRLTELYRAWSACQGCNLSAERNSVVFGYGNPSSQVLVVGEAPGKNEDLQGVPFVGQAGMLLDQYFASVSVLPDLMEMAKNEDFIYDVIRDQLLKSIFYTNVVCCRPPENRDPSTTEIESCRPRLLETIYLVDPVLIIGAGRIPVEVLLGKRLSITQSHGEVYDVAVPGRLTEVHYPMLALLHPSYLLRINDFQQKGGMADKTFQHVLLAMHIVDWFNHLHYGRGLPEDRQPMKKKD